MPKIDPKFFTENHMTPITRKIKEKLYKNMMPETGKTFEQI